MSLKAQFIILLLLINYCIIFQTSNCTPTFTLPCIPTGHLNGFFCNDLLKSFTNFYWVCLYWISGVKYSGCRSFVRYFEKIFFHSIAFSLVFDKKKYNFPTAFSFYVLQRKNVSLSPGLEVMLFSSNIVLAFVFISMILFKLSFILKWGQDQGLVSSIQITSCSSTVYQKAMPFPQCVSVMPLKKIIFFSGFSIISIYVLSLHHYHTILTPVAF